MKRIDLDQVNYLRKNEPNLLFEVFAHGINEIMDYLEHMTRTNGKIWTCVNCGHATGWVGDLGKCCDNPLYEVSG